MAGKVVGAKFPDNDVEHFEMLADAMSRETGKTVSVSAVLRVLAKKGLEANPVDDVARARFRKRKATGATSAPELKVDRNGKLRAVLDDEESGVTSAPRLAGLARSLTRSLTRDNRLTGHRSQAA